VTLLRLAQDKTHLIVKDVGLLRVAAAFDGGAFH
jgi:hypothetical protein